MNWIAMALVLTAVWQLSEGKTISGNWFMMFGSMLWGIIGAMQEMYPLMGMNIILVVRAAWMLITTNRINFVTK